MHNGFALYIALGVLLAVAPFGAQAHTAMPTRVLVVFEHPGEIDVKIDVDLVLLLGSPERYYELVTTPREQQRRDIDGLVPRLSEAVQLHVGSERLALKLADFTPAQASREEFLDSSTSKLSTFILTGTLPNSRAPLRLIVPIAANVPYPIAFTIQIPAAHLSRTRWLDGGMHESDAFDWADKAQVPAMSWWRQLGMYLRLGFEHIVPQGADHILFVLGLFFLGISWRKLLSQTTVFTIAHATTLFLSTYGIFTLPSRYVEPAIALSIAVIALENVFKPKLGPGRLALVFAFGLVHGLGFASSLSEIPFPQHDFLIALLGFNFGVDLGQLCVIAAAFVVVGAFKDRDWFRIRIAIPCSFVIAGIGVLWAIQRVSLMLPRQLL